MSKKQPLNDRHRAILRFIRKYIREHGFSPSMDEICQAVNVSTKSLLVYYLDRLEAEGHIRRAPKIPRSIVLTGG